MNVSIFRGTHGVSSKTIRVYSSMTCVGSLIEQRFIFLLVLGTYAVDAWAFSPYKLSGTLQEKSELLSKRFFAVE